MANELDAATLDAILRSRRIARKAGLLAQAKGKWAWKSVVAGICILALTGLFWRSKNMSQELFYAMMLLFLVASWSEDRLSRRLDAIVRLLEDPAEV